MATDRRHDPGPWVAKMRAEALPLREAAPIRPRQGGEILVGTAGWTDPTLTSPGLFYPPGIDSAATRLQYYASRFRMVEVDSPYYALPARRTVELWVERTPPDFRFNVKANALMTGHPSEVNRLPKELRDELPQALKEKEKIYAKDLPAELYDAVWAYFIDALLPLDSSGKLGFILLQYPRWFVPSRKNVERLIDTKHRLGDFAGAVEFRNALWLDRRNRERTLELLKQFEMPFVIVDGPQGLRSSIPPIVAVTSPRIAVVRLHGRRVETWQKPGVTVSERYRYLYEKRQLQPWVPQIVDMAQDTETVHVVHNNCHANYGTTNALEIMQLLIEFDEETRMAG